MVVVVLIVVDKVELLFIIVLIKFNRYMKNNLNDRNSVGNENNGCVRNHVNENKAHGKIFLPTKIRIVEIKTNATLAHSVDNIMELLLART